MTRSAAPSPSRENKASASTDCGSNCLPYSCVINDSERLGHFD
jgi:hypothetical protein